MYIVRISVRFLLLMNVFSCDIDVDASVQKQYHFIMECLEAFQIQIHICSEQDHVVPSSNNPA